MNLSALRGLRWKLVVAMAALGLIPVAVRGFDPRLEVLWLMGVLALGGGMLLSLPGGRPQHEGLLAGGLAGLASGVHAAWTVHQWFREMPLAPPPEGAAVVPLLGLFLVGLLGGWAGGALAAWMQRKAPLGDSTESP